MTADLDHDETSTIFHGDSANSRSATIPRSGRRDSGFYAKPAAISGVNPRQEDTRDRRDRPPKKASQWSQTGSKNRSGATR